MKKPILTLLYCVPAFTLMALAQEEEGGPAPAENVDPQVGREIPDDLQHWGVPHDPFWPLGYVAPDKPITNDGPIIDDGPTNSIAIPKGPVFTPEWERAIKRITARRIKATTNGYIAIIDRMGVCSEGSVVHAKYKELKYTWLIEKISKKSIKYKQLTFEPIK